MTYDGRPQPPGRPSSGPDIIAELNGKPVIVEVKGTLGSKTVRPALRQNTLTTRLKVGKTKQAFTQPSAAWLRTNPNRYLDAMRRTDPRAAGTMSRVTSTANPSAYDAIVIVSRPKGRAPYGEGVDKAAEAIRASPQVTSLKIIDIERSPR